MLFKNIVICVVAEVRQHSHRHNLLLNVLEFLKCELTGAESALGLANPNLVAKSGRNQVDTALGNIDIG